jgi:hypothetical protein
LENRIGLFLPVVLDPVGSLSWGPITPANPGPPPPLNFPVHVQPNPDRRFVREVEFIEAHFDTAGEPPGHGFDPTHPERSWYSVSPAPGLRLIVLNSATPLIELPAQVYPDGAISLPQAVFLRGELEGAQARGESVVVTTHHPSDALERTYGSVLTPRSFRRLLNVHRDRDQLHHRSSAAGSGDRDLARTWGSRR